MRMATTNAFTCPNNHKFDAVAKLRARCPNCGMMARRQFNAVTPEPVKPSESPKTFGRKKVLTSVSPTSPKVDTPIDTGTSSQRVTVSKKVKSLVSTEEPDSLNTLPSKKVKIVKQGLQRPAQLPKRVEPVKAAKKPVATRGPVSRVKAKPGHAPSVTNAPKGSRQRKVVEQLTEDIPYWRKVQRKFGI